MEHSKSASWWSCFLLMLLLFIHSCPSSARVLGNETDRMALLDIKLHISDPSGFLISWNDSQHHCQWLGVGCDMRHGRVINLSLSGMTLSGTISPHLGNLSFIRSIQLGENQFHGEIPHQIGQLSRLRSLDLSYNALSGKIPVNLSRCLEIRNINLLVNKLIGDIPFDLGFLPKLESLGLAANNLTGKIPASLGNLSLSLLHLSLSYNNLEGFVPSELGLLNRLVFLALGTNKLRGEIPASLFNISSLTNFTAPDNFLSGTLPDKLPFFQVFGIAGNNVTGKIPISITNCTNLEILDLGDNNFEGKVPTSLGQLHRLQILSVQGNSLGGNYLDFLVPLTNCTKLTILSLDNNNFSGELSSTIGNLSSELSALHFVNNKISGAIPTELENLVKLDHLELGDNSLTGVIPANLARLSNLAVLYLKSSGLSGQIPSPFCTNLTKLYSLSLDDNNFVGDLSHSLGECRNLQELFISNNKLSGMIPSHMFGSYLSPTELVLASNSLSGTLPIEIGNMINLRSFIASDNKLFGQIPQTIGYCSVLAAVDMHNNHFNGSLPPSLASLKALEHLDLSSNSLTGTIPSGLNKLIYLNYLNLSYNDLEGEVPIDGVFSNASNIMLDGNSKLCGGILELGLPACSIANRKTKRKNHFKIILIALLPTLVISIILFLFLFLHKKKSDGVRKEMSSVPSEKMLRVSYHQLYRATEGFSLANLIGSGAFGVVYKGKLENHDVIQFVAVKVVDIRKRGASKSFKAECKALSNLRHRNLLPLLTYCSSIDSKGDEFMGLVYKYMENGSLDMWLHPDQPHEPTTTLNLLQRLNIAIDVALALDYLHNHSHIKVAHCDLKPSNVLLDNDLTAYLGDFGLARLLPQIQQGTSSSTIAIKGSIGYAAPEYAMGLKVSTQGDVYSYGILLLEMFTGKRPTDDVFSEGLDLHNYVKVGVSNQVWRVVDPSLLSRESQQHSQAALEDDETKLMKTQECLVSILKIGLRCSQGSGKDRMDMKQVTTDLHFIRDAFR